MPQSLGAVDLAIIAIFIISTIISLWRGFLKELLSLLVWVAAFVIAQFMSPFLYEPLSTYVQPPILARMVSYIVLFFTTLLLGSLVTRLLLSLLSGAGLSVIDRMLGVVFGLARAGIIITVIFTIVRFFQFDQLPLFQESILLPYFDDFERWSRQFSGLDLRNPAVPGAEKI
ncbi:MAG: CvpA family protein [Pseudomonadota bacterium]